jgi:16S rRNA (cytosine967-C5)-methyltransferase
MNRPPRPRRSNPPVPIPGVDAPSASGPRAASIAANVIRWSNRESPADHVLRAELKKARGLDGATAALAARLVFSFYRWQEWLGNDGSMEGRVAKALELQEQFNHEPLAWSEDELARKAVPPWTAHVMAPTPQWPAWLRSLQTEPIVWLRARPGLGNSLSSQLKGASPGPIQDALSYTGTENLFLHPQFQAGSFEIQDLASQIVGLVCAPRAGQTWWDACAGEGGKTMHFSALMENKGLIWATDRAQWRLVRLKRRAARARVFNYRVATWDGGERLPTKTMFDGVLIDAPCSGLGTWQRNPHARWTATPADVEELAAVQQTLLDRVAKSIKPSGHLIYSVCTLTSAETSAVVSAFGAAHPEFILDPPSLPEVPPATPTPDPKVLWLWPQDIRANGMFIARWRRT